MDEFREIFWEVFSFFAVIGVIVFITWVIFSYSQELKNPTKKKWIRIIYIIVLIVVIFFIGRSVVINGQKSMVIRNMYDTLIDDEDGIHMLIDRIDQCDMRDDTTNQKITADQNVIFMTEPTVTSTDVESEAPQQTTRLILYEDAYLDGDIPWQRILDLCATDFNNVHYVVIMDTERYYAASYGPNGSLDAYEQRINVEIYDIKEMTRVVSDQVEGSKAPGSTSNTSDFTMAAPKLKKVINQFFN